MRKKIFSFLVLAFALVTFSGCKGQSAAEIDILENSKETNQIVWGVKTIPVFWINGYRDQRSTGIRY